MSDNDDEEDLNKPTEGGAGGLLDQSLVTHRPGGLHYKIMKQFREIKRGKGLSFVLHEM